MGVVVPPASSHSLCQICFVSFFLSMCVCVYVCIYYRTLSLPPSPVHNFIVHSVEKKTSVFVCVELWIIHIILLLFD